MPRSTTDIAVTGLGAALVVFFAGTAAALATGNSPPTEMWAAGGAVSGGLLGLLMPSPMISSPTEAGVADLREAVAEHKTAAESSERDAAGKEAAGDAAGASAARLLAAQSHTKAAEQHEKAASIATAASQKVEPRLAVVLLLVVFVVLLAGGYLLASGEVKPPAEFHKSLEGLTTAVVALASAAGSALLGMLAPNAGQAAAHK